MNEFRKLGVITYNRHGIALNRSMLRQLPDAAVATTQQVWPHTSPAAIW